MTMLRRVLWIAVAGSVFVGAGGANAAPPSNYMLVGARPMALGGAFVGLADDVHSSAWNPAGLPRLQRQEYTGTYLATPMLADFTTWMAAATLPIGDRQALGLDLFSDQFDDGTLTVDNLRVGLSYGLAVHRFVSLGIAARYMAPNTVSSFGTEVDNGTAFGFDAGLLFDLGVLMPELETLKLGVTGHNLSGTSMTHDTDVSEVIYPATYTVGASYYPLESLMLTADVNLQDRLHVGAEFSPLNLLALRGGLMRDMFNNGSDLYYTGGFGISWKGIGIDYVVQTHPVLDMSHYVSVSFVYNPSFVQIKDAALAHNPLYRSLYRYYELSTDRFADITLKNTAQEPLPVTMGIKVPTMTTAEKFYEEQVTLQPQSTTTFTMRVAFSDSVLLSESSTYDRFIQPEVVVTYTQENEVKQASRQMQTTLILGKNKMTWGDPRRVASFIYPNHTTVVTFVEQVLARHSDLADRFPKIPNLAKAMIIFDTLGRMGINYNPDPSTPFYKISGDSAAAGSIADLVRYPPETFEAKGGDCDDLMVLYASLLQAANVETAILDVFDPSWGHVYMMFNSGVPPEQAGEVFVDSTEYVEWEGKIWIPVETTMYGKPFTDAWSEGGREYYAKLNMPNGPYIRAFDVQDAVNVYPAGIVGGKIVELPEAGVVDELFALDVGKYNRRITTAGAATIDGPVTAEKLYHQAVFFVTKDLLDESLTSLDQALAMDPKFADALNAKGISLTRKGNRVRFEPFGVERADTFYAEAVGMFDRAISVDPYNAGFRINQALLYKVMNRDDDARRAYSEAVNLDQALPGEFDDLFPQ